MFLRAHKSGNHTYLRLVESYRLHGQPRQRVVAHLGRKDLLAPHLDSLVRLLQADQEAPRWVASEQVAAPQAWSWGPLHAARHLFDELALGPLLDGVSATRHHGQPLSERVFVLLANRLTRPGSEHALAQWLEDFYVVTAGGSRWRPQWKQSRRVKVACEQLRLWYQTLDDLLAHKASIETAIWRQLRDLFSLAPELGACVRGGAGVVAGPRAGEEAAGGGQRAVLGGGLAGLGDGAGGGAGIGRAAQTLCHARQPPSRRSAAGAGPEATT